MKRFFTTPLRIYISATELCMYNLNKNNQNQTMGENNRTEYLEQLKRVIQELKKLKEIMRIDGDQDTLDEIRKTSEVFTDIDYDFSVGVEEIYKIWGYYLLNSGMSDKEKESNWINISNLLLILMKIQSHSDYIQSNQIFFEDLLTAIENREIEI